MGELHNQFEDIFTENNQIQEALSRSYETPNFLDENKLEEELDELGVDLSDDEEFPSYLQDLPKVPTNIVPHKNTNIQDTKKKQKDGEMLNI